MASYQCAEINASDECVAWVEAPDSSFWVDLQSISPADAQSLGIAIAMCWLLAFLLRLLRKWSTDL